MRLSCVFAGMLASFLGSWAPAQTPKVLPRAEPLKVYKDPVGKVSFTYPSSWDGRPLSQDDISMLLDSEPVHGFYVRARDTGVYSIRFVYRVITGVQGEACKHRFESLAGDNVKITAKRMNEWVYFYAESGGVATAQSFDAVMYGTSWRGNCLIFEDDTDTDFPDDKYETSRGTEDRVGRRKDARAQAKIAAIEGSIRLW